MVWRVACGESVPKFAVPMDFFLDRAEEWSLVYFDFLSSDFFLSDV